MKQFEHLQPEIINDFKACRFFSDCKQELKGIVQQSHYETKISKRMKKIDALPDKNNCEQEQNMLMHNIVIDHLRHHNFNYTYSVFMTEADLVSSEIIVNKKLLGELIGIQEQSQFQEGRKKLTKSILELMLRKISEISKYRELQHSVSIQTEPVQSDTRWIEGSKILSENRVREIREEVEMREKKYYNKMLESFKAKELLAVREDISREFEEKYRKRREKLEEQYRKMEVKNAGTEQNEEKYDKSYVQKLMLEMKSVKKQKLILEDKVQQLNLHKCQKTKEWKEMEQMNKQQRSYLDKKNKELDLALRNMSTKVEQFVKQKNAIMGTGNENQTDKFVQQIHRNKASKDHMIETIQGELRQMNKRIELIANENETLRATVRELKSKIKQQQQKLSQSQESAHGPKKSEKLNPSKIPLLQQNNNKNKKQLEPKMKDVMVSVQQTDLNNNIGGLNVEEKRQQQLESSEDSDEFEEQLKQNKRIIELQSEMRLVKNKLRLLAENIL